MSFLIKGIVGFLGAGVVATGAVYLGTDVFNSRKPEKKTAIRELLRVSNPEKRLITSSQVSDKAWKESWKNYRGANRGKKVNEDTWKLSSWTTPPESIPDTDDASSYFIAACSLNKEKEVLGTDDPLYTEVLSYCTRNTVVSDLISENYPDKKILTSDLDDGDGWSAAWTKYKSDNSGKTDQNSDTWKLNGWPTSTPDTVLESFKTECGKKIDVVTFRTDNVDYLNAVKWCTK